MSKARLRSMLKDITEQLNQLSREELKKEIDACPTFHIILERMGIIEPDPKDTPVQNLIQTCSNCGQLHTKCSHPIIGITNCPNWIKKGGEL